MVHGDFVFSKLLDSPLVQQEAEQGIGTMDAATETLVKELHEQIADLRKKLVERDASIRALTGELIKKRTEVDYPVGV